MQSRKGNRLDPLHLWEKKKNHKEITQIGIFLQAWAPAAGPHAWIFSSHISNVGTTVAVVCRRISFFKEALMRWEELTDTEAPWTIRTGIRLLQVMHRDMSTDEKLAERKGGAMGITQSSIQPHEGASEQEARKDGEEENGQTWALRRISLVRSKPSGTFLCGG